MSDGWVSEWYAFRWPRCIPHKHPIAVLYLANAASKICPSLTPPARPSTSSPTFQLDTLPPSCVMVPENSTPRTVDDPGGAGYFPSRWLMSILFKPNALICDAPCLGWAGHPHWIVGQPHLYKNLCRLDLRRSSLPNIEVLGGALPIFDKDSSHIWIVEWYLWWLDDWLILNGGVETQDFSRGGGRLRSGMLINQLHILSPQRRRHRFAKLITGPYRHRIKIRMRGKWEALRRTSKELERGFGRTFTNH